MRPIPFFLLTLLPLLAQAQSSCSSDGQLRPLALVERFINADCDSCWSDPATPQPQAREVALDWILPGSKGEDAPLSAAASRDGLLRLAALGRPQPAQAEAVRSPLLAAARSLRVAHGLPFNNYIGASIELRPAGRSPWTAWLALVETVPAGTEGTPVERNLVRNLLQPPWNGLGALSKAQQMRLFEARPLSIPEGANPERLRVVGWVQDARGDIRAIAQSRCAPQGPQR
ncbi:hypothetical protein [uncultured Ramlibacter sp.]|uniref:hypothetical protein n=1 Tax=uncultured Ramlibacter sp. TaxID=260755 RepID=UPI002617DB93|nr:hypothetical protein [uncultured Ramlibacter sp.]